MDAASKRRRLALVHANVFLYAFAYWLTQPVLPYLSSTLGASPVVFGWLMSFFSVVQLVGGPVIGRVIDVYGAVPALVLSQLSAAAGYLLLGASYDVRTLFLSRLPTLGMHAMHASQAAVALVTDEETRAASLGRLSLSYGVGFVLGPLVGGTASQYLGYHGTAAVAGASSLALAAYTYATAAGGAQAAAAAAAAKPDAAAAAKPAAAGLSLAEVWRVLRNPAVGGLLLVKLAAGLAIALFHSTFSMAAEETFGLTAQQNGFVMSFAGGITIVFNSFVVGAVTSRCSPAATVRGAILVVAASFVGLSSASGIAQVAAVCVPLVGASTVLSTVCTSTLTTSASRADAGTVLGLDMGAGTLARVVAPVAGGFVLQNYGFSVVGLLGAALASLAFVVAGLATALDRKAPPAAGRELLEHKAATPKAQ